MRNLAIWFPLLLWLIMLLVGATLATLVALALLKYIRSGNKQ